MPSICDGTQWWGHCLWTLTSSLALSFSHSFPLPENRPSQWLRRDSPSSSHPSPSQTGRDSESHTLNAFPQARNSRVVLPLAHVSFQLSLVPSLPLFSPSLPGRSFFICPLSQPFSLAAMTLAARPRRHPRGCGFACREVAECTELTVCSYTQPKYVSVCLSHLKIIHKIDDGLHAISISAVNMACNFHYHTSKTMKRWESTGEKIGGCRHYIFLFIVKACLIAILFSISVKLISLRVFWENSAKRNIKALRHSVHKEL